MDFLDPDKKRARSIRLTIGHILMALLVLVSTSILVFRAYGYDVDRKTGQVIQNGLVFIDSAPSGAKIKLNGQEQKNNTNTRMELPEGEYTLEISKNGYHTWQRTFELDGAQVLRYTYPMLIPSNLQTSQLKTFDKPVTFISQSPDRRWILLGQKNSVNKMTLYDLEKRNNDQPTFSSITFPGGLFTSAKGDHSLKAIEWSDDNKHLLVQHTWKGGHEYLMLNRDQPDKSTNLNKTLNQNLPRPSLFNKSPDKLYIYQPKTRNLSIVDLKSKQNNLFAANVISFKPHGRDTVLMAIVDPKNKASAEIVLRQKDKDYVLRRVPSTASILLDIAQYSGKWFVAIGSPAEKKTYVYKDPIDFANHNYNPKSVRTAVLKSPGAISDVSFSKNTRFIMANSGQHFSVYDAELDRIYSYQINQKFDSGQRPSWMDGHRLVAYSGGQALIFDYDGINIHKLVSGDSSTPIMFDRDYKELYLVNKPSKPKDKYALTITQLRLSGDK